MKQFVLIILCFSLNLIFAQNKRTKNSGVVCAYNFGKDNQRNPSFEIKISKQIGKFLLPEIGLRFENEQFATSFSAYTAALQFRKSLFKLSVRNKSGICKAEVLECFVTPEYYYFQNSNRLNPQNQYAMRYGLSLYHLKTGGARNSKSWVTKLEFYNRTIFTTHQNELGIALRVQCFRPKRHFGNF